MRIINRQAFLALPAGTLFAKYQPCDFGELEIKDDSLENDWFEVQLIPWPKDCDDSGELIGRLRACEHGAAYGEMDFDLVCRDGLYDQDQLFAVFEAADAAALYERLQRALVQGYRVNPFSIGERPQVLIGRTHLMYELGVAWGVVIPLQDHVLALKELNARDPEKIEQLLRMTDAASHYVMDRVAEADGRIATCDNPEVAAGVRGED